MRGAIRNSARASLVCPPHTGKRNMASDVAVSTGLLSPLNAAAYDGNEPSRVRLELGGVLVDRIDLAKAIDRIQQFVRSGKPHQVVTVNLDFLSLSARNPEFR